MKATPIYVYDIRKQFSEPIIVIWCDEEHESKAISITKDLGYTEDVLYITRTKMHGSSGRRAPRVQATGYSIPHRVPRLQVEVTRLTKENRILRDKNIALLKQFNEMNDAFVSASATIGATILAANKLKGT